MNTNTNSRIRGRLVLNGSTGIRGTLGEIAGVPTSLLTAIWLQTMVPLAQGDTVKLQGTFRNADAFWGAKVG